MTKPYRLLTDDVFTVYEYYIENFTPFPVEKPAVANAASTAPERFVYAYIIFGFRKILGLWEGHRLKKDLPCKGIYVCIF